MQNTISKNLRNSDKGIMQKIFGKNNMYLFRGTGTFHTQYVLNILGSISLLFLFTIRIHFPQESIGNTQYLIGNIFQQSMIQTPVNNMIMDPIPDFGYELKGNSYSYPVPFFE